MAHPAHDHRRHPGTRRPVPVRMVRSEPTPLGGSEHRLLSPCRGSHHRLPIRTGIRHRCVRSSLCCIGGRGGRVYAHDGWVWISTFRPANVRGHGSGLGQYFPGSYDDFDWDWLTCCIMVLWGEVEEMEHQGLVMVYRFLVHSRVQSR